MLSMSPRARRVAGFPFSSLSGASWPPGDYIMTTTQNCGRLKHTAYIAQRLRSNTVPGLQGPRFAHVRIWAVVQRSAAVCHGASMQSCNRDADPYAQAKLDDRDLHAFDSSVCIARGKVSGSGRMLVRAERNPPSGLPSLFSLAGLIGERAVDLGVSAGRQQPSHMAPYLLGPRWRS